MKKKQGQQQLSIDVEYYKWTVSTGSMWAVLYRGQPFQIRREHALRTEHKYITTTSTQRGTAERLARKLNALFDTSEFIVTEVTAKTTH
jgi:hypothetical protein